MFAKHTAESSHWSAHAILVAEETSLLNIWSIPIQIHSRDGCDKSIVSSLQASNWNKKNEQQELPMMIQQHHIVVDNCIVQMIWINEYLGDHVFRQCNQTSILNHNYIQCDDFQMVGTINIPGAI